MASRHKAMGSDASNSVKDTSHGTSQAAEVTNAAITTLHNRKRWKRGGSLSKVSGSKRGKSRVSSTGFSKGAVGVGSSTGMFAKLSSGGAGPRVVVD